MIANPLLSIAIPTYNRCELLDRCLGVHIPLARQHNIRIYISDNASSDATQRIVMQRMSEYSLISYCRSETNLGMDGNFENALRIAQTEYVWLLGDTYSIPSVAFEYFFKLISTSTREYDALVFNVRNRVKDVAAQDYVDRNNLLSDLGWHMTCLASLVYNAKVIRNSDFKRFANTDLVQTGILFEYLGRNEIYVNWVNSISVQSLMEVGEKKNGWLGSTFEIWVDKWPNMIFSLPAAYRLDVKLKCIKEHGIKSGLFTLMSLLYLRGCNILNRKSYKKYSKFFPLTIIYPGFVICLISLIPKFAINLVYILIKKIAGIIIWKS